MVCVCLKIVNPPKGHLKRRNDDKPPVLGVMFWCKAISGTPRDRMRRPETASVDADGCSVSKSSNCPARKVHNLTSAVGFLRSIPSIWIHACEFCQKNTILKYRKKVSCCFSTHVSVSTLRQNAAKCYTSGTPIVPLLVGDYGDHHTR